MTNKKTDGNVAGEKSGGSEYSHSEVPEDGHVRYRKCAACGALDMAPKSAFQGTGLDRSTDSGLTYVCRQCGATAEIKDSGALFMGLLYSVFWGAVGLWALDRGPLWYLRHLSYFDANDPWYFWLIDLGVIALSLAVAAFSAWIIWTFLLGPLKTLIQHPVTNENRAKTETEVATETKSRRATLMSLFVYPLFIWAPLLGLFWAIDALGFNIRDNQFIAYAAVGAIILIAWPIGKRLGANPVFIFVGMAFWMAAFVGVIFFMASL